MIWLLKISFRLFFIIIISVICFVSISCATYHYDTGFFNNYPDLEQTEQFTTYLSRKYPHLVKLHALGLTAEGRTIWALHIGSDKYPQSHKPALLFTGLVHSDEWISLPVILYLVHKFTSTYEYDQDIQHIMDRASLWFIPVVNPDGYVYSRSGDRNWRKNRARYGNSFSGVDINRNFDVMWDIKGGFSKDPASRFYRGPSPASEPETKALQELAARVHFQAAVDFHSFGQYILYPNGYSRTQCPDDELFRQMAARMAQEIINDGGSVYTPLQMCRIYPKALPSGTLMDYLYATYHTLAFTIELPPKTKKLGGVCPAAGYILSAGNESLSAFRVLCRWIIERENSSYN
ncbi:MAG: hypothetical protein JW822_02420 [Spirochaetales bacterium]|nr:hypothetical protein [Spirochaetales bacterium]